MRKPNRPSIDELVERASALRPVLAERAAATEELGRVSEASTTELKAAKLFEVLKPAKFGGFEYPPTALLRVSAEVGRACGSSAWCLAVGNGNAWVTSYWPDQAQAEVWADASNLVAGTAMPTGKCTPVDGGCMVEGRWPFASNCDNSEWIFVAAALPQHEDDPADAAWCMVPRVSLETDHGSWRVSGLQGTGSKTVFVSKPLFVPEHRVVRYSSILAANPPGRAATENVLARFGFSTFSAVILVGPLLGMAQGALDWFVGFMQSKARLALTPGQGFSVAHAANVQAAVGATSAAIDSAFALLFADVGAAEQKVLAGETLTEAERVAVRRAVAFAARQASVAVNQLFEASGVSASSISVPMQRHWRDLNAGARHAGLDYLGIYGLVGRQRFGLPLAGQY